MNALMKDSISGKFIEAEPKITIVRHVPFSDLKTVVKAFRSTGAEVVSRSEDKANEYSVTATYS